MVLDVILLEHFVGGAGQIVHERLEGNLDHVVEAADLLVEGVQGGCRVEQLEKVLEWEREGESHIVDDGQLLRF